MRKDMAEAIAQSFITQLEKGVVPWRKPWSASGVMPHNYFSKHVYRGINTMLLGISSMEAGYTSPAWTTYKAAADRGAQVRKGEKGTTVVFWNLRKVEDKKTGEEKMIPLMRSFTVFNTDQVDGIDWIAPEREKMDIPLALKAIEEGYKDAPTILHSPSDRAYYEPGKDWIVLPLIEQFISLQGYAETQLHEFVHSTGHPSRLHRFETGSVGHTGEYAKEELVAEIGATMLMHHANIEVDMQQMGSYVQSWLKALSDDHSLIIKAAQAAQRAVDYILGVKFEDSND
jgi:antirestriction protein ArdC